MLEVQLQVALTKYEHDCECTLSMRGDPATYGPDWPLREGPEGMTE